MEEGSEQNNSSVEPVVAKRGISPLMVVVILLALGLLGYLVFSRINKASSPAMTPNSAAESESMMDGETQPVASDSAMSNGNVREFTVDGSSYEFDPSTITVNKGDTVKITFKDDDGTHNLVISGYNVSTKILGSGTEEVVTFVADKVGSFEFYCSVANHKALGMTGTLVVQ